MVALVLRSNNMISLLWEQIIDTAPLTSYFSRATERNGIAKRLADIGVSANPLLSVPSSPLHGFEFPTLRESVDSLIPDRYLLHYNLSFTQVRAKLNAFLDADRPQWSAK
jgi:hypothetical protein